MSTEGSLERRFYCSFWETVGVSPDIDAMPESSKANSTRLLSLLPMLVVGLRSIYTITFKRITLLWPHRLGNPRLAKYINLVKPEIVGTVHFRTDKDSLFLWVILGLRDLVFMWWISSYSRPHSVDII
ncbi:hypothetical protein CBL_04744 [Carabus blaptoides fortunei]